MRTKYKYGSYAIAAAALGTAPEAEASIIWFDNPNTVLTADTNFNLDGDGAIDFLLDITASDPASVFWTPTAGNGVIVANDASGDIVPLALNFEIDGTLPGGVKYAADGRLLEDKGAVSGQWANDLNSPALIGLGFQISGNTHYGWARVGAAIDTDTNAASAIVYDWAYESDPDTMILAGDMGTQSTDVPEPSSIALMALGAAGIAALKLRKRA